MPPIRRYVRISPYSVLEVRIFLENPADTTRWLLARPSPALPQVMEAVRPLILPKLREEVERTAMTKGKGKKGKSVKDVVEGDGFRVVVFLTEGGTRHEVAVKRKTARETGVKRRKLGGEMQERDEEVVIREEEEDDDDGDINLSDLPAARGDEDDDDHDDLKEVGSRAHRRRDVDDDESPDYQDDKKQLGFNTRYEGFGIWGKVLCLLVERKGGPVGKKNGAGAIAASGSEGAQKVMHEWISSTQVGADEEPDDG